MILILHSRDKALPAGRLEEAAAALGYPASGLDAETLQTVPTDRLRAAGALIVLWSKGTMASDVVKGAAGEARRQGKLIEASADGIMPVAALDEPGAALISGWRGEPFHPGWQRIATELGKICGAPAPAPPPAASAAASPAPAAVATAAAAAGTGGARTFSRSTAMILAGFLVLLFAGVGAAAWIGRDAPDAPTVAATAPAPVETGPSLEQLEQYVGVDELQPVEGEDETVAPPQPPAASPAAAARREAADARSAPKAAAKSPPRVAARAPAFDLAAWCAGAGRSSDRCRDLRREARREQRAEARADGDRPIRYRNARNMRRFCEGAGRRTPQCRTFLRNTAS